MKLKVVQMSRDNPSWSIEMLREKSGCRYLENKETLDSWVKQVNLCASPAERRDVIHRTIIGKCIKYQKKDDKQFNNELLLKWASEACQECLPSKSAIRQSSRFYSSSDWLMSFKNSHNIAGSNQLEISGPIVVNPEPLDRQEKNNGNLILF